jgi:hypothetical protein
MKHALNVCPITLLETLMNLNSLPTPEHFHSKEYP